MKTIRTSLLIAAIITANHFPKTAATPLSPSASDMSVLLQAVEATTPLAASNAPLLGNFYSAQHAPGSASPWPPLPGNISDSPVWSLGDGLYLLDDLNVSYAKSMTGMHAMDDAGPPLPGGGGEGTNEGGSFPIYTFPTNGLWLQVTNISNGQVYLNLMNATDSVYEVMSKTDLTLTNWTIEPGEVWPTNTNAMPFTVNQAGRTNLFLWAADWTGVTTEGNQTPSWWFYYYYGAAGLSLSDTDWDSTGQNTLLTDYQNNFDPNVISFTMSFTNYNVNTSPADGAVTITGGTPFYEAILLNDTNEADAVWEPYTGTNVTVPLTWGNGLYTVSVGLRGLPTNATPTWLQAQLTFNNLAPTLTLTNPVSSTVSTPLIQLQGYVSVSLSKLTFDVSNAAGVFTNQQGYWQPLFYDTNLMQFTTNSFQCYDVALTNGLNTITLHATDGAGNSATTNFSYTLSYAGVTNAPLLSLIWPTNGTMIGGTNFTLQATVDDATASVTAFITDTNGDTNTVQALVERDGTVWVNNLPLNAGTNQVTLSATNAAGLSSQTNFEVIGNDVGLVVDPISGDQLNQPSVSVTGSINDTNDTVSVNGVAAYFTDDCGDWEADGVSVNPTGTAGLDVEVADADDNPVAAQAVSQPQPASVVISSYAASSANVYIGYVSWCEGNGPVTGGNATTDWVSGKGSSYDYGTTWDGECSDAPNVHDTAADLSGYTNDLPVTWENATASEGGDFSATISVQTTMMIEPAGQSTAKGNALYLVLASAMGFSDVGNLLNGYAGDTPLAPETLKVNGQTLVNSGLTNDDGSTWGMTLISAPSGATVPLTTTAPVGNTFTNQVFQLVSQCVATTPSDQSRTNLGVCEQAYLYFNPAPPTTNITWNVSAGSLSRTNGIVTLFTAPDNATNVTVTATIGSAPVNFHFKVFAPTGALLENVAGSLITSTNPLALAYYANWYVQPDSVSFYHVKIAEGFTNAVTTGYFTYQQGLLHTPGSSLQGGSVVLGKGTLCGGGYPFGYDQISGNSQGPPYSNGTFIWHIPWSYITLDGKTNYFTTVDHIETLTVTSSNAVLTVQKQGSSGSITNNF